MVDGDWYKVYNICSDYVCPFVESIGGFHFPLLSIRLSNDVIRNIIYHSPPCGPFDM